MHFSVWTGLVLQTQKISSANFWNLTFANLTFNDLPNMPAFWPSIMVWQLRSSLWKLPSAVYLSTFVFRAKNPEFLSDNSRSIT